MYRTQVEKQFNTTIKILQSDWGGEYRSFVPHLQKNEIIFRHLCPHTHHQNGTVERKHRHIVEMGLTLLTQAHLPLSFWWEAFHTSAYLVNRLPTPVLPLTKSPFETLFKFKPDYSFLKFFGYSYFPYLRFYSKHKLNFHTTKCVFLSYSSEHKGYKCLSSKGVIYIARHIVFNELEFPFSGDPLFTKQSSSSQASDYRHLMFKVSSMSVPVYDSSRLSDNVMDPSQSTSSAASSSPPAPLHSSPASSSSSSSSSLPHSPPLPSSPTPPPQSFNQQSLVPAPVQLPSHPIITRAKAGIFKPKFLAYSTALEENEPAIVSQALADPKWKATMQAEYDTLMANQT